MTPTVEWHDNEPEFPDFLPPKPASIELTVAQAAERIKDVLAAAGIDIDTGIDIDGAWVSATFPDGAWGCYELYELLTHPYRSR